MNPLKKPIKLSPLHIHVICWSVLFIYELLVSYSFSGKFSNFYDYAGHYLLNIGLFYFNTYFTLNKCMNKSRRSYLLLFIMLVAEFAAYLLLKKIMYNIFLSTGIYSMQNMPTTYVFVVQGLWRFVYFVGISFAFWIFLSKLRQGKQIAAMEQQQLLDLMEKEAVTKELLVAENSYLKAQINPHFLFNVLGFIHNQVYKVSGPAGETVTILADMMRYALSKPQPDDLVDLDDEVEHINNYILINQHRFDHRLQIVFEHNIGDHTTRIIPLLLITIVENIFKYGDLTDAGHPAKISLDVANNQINFFVNNKILRQNSGYSTGIGMSNIQKRLTQFYPNTHTLSVENDSNYYTLNLTITQS